MTIDMNRRQFVAALAAMPFAARAATVPVIDTHIHLFDRRRPQGVPWPREDDPIPGISALPPRYRELVEPFGVVGAIAVEASSWLEDNQWMLEQLEPDPIMVGTVGFLDPGKPEFGRNLERFHRSELFLGIRRDRSDLSMADGLEKAEFVSDLRLLADAGLSLDSARQPPSVWLRLTDRVPSLRLIVPHLPSTPLPEGRAAVDAYMVDLRELGQRPHVYMKLSAIIRPIDGNISTNLDVYRDRLDQLWSIFSEDRVLFGSDWPNSLHAATYGDVMSLARAYVATKDRWRKRRFSGEIPSQRTDGPGEIRLSRRSEDPRIRTVINGDAFPDRRQQALRSRVRDRRDICAASDLTALRLFVIPGRLLERGVGDVVMLDPQLRARIFDERLDRRA